MLLQELNDDCLEHIFQFVNLEQQFRIKGVCQRFANIIETIWRCKHKKVDCKDEYYRYMVANTKAFRHYMTILSETVEELSLNETEQLNSLATLAVPMLRVKSLTATFMTYDVHLAEMFPTLKRLDLNCRLQFRWECDVLWAWVKSFHGLTELCLNECVWLCANFDLMRRLRKISVHQTDHVRLILRYVTQSDYCDRVHTLSYNFKLYFYEPYPFGRFKNIRRLNFLGTARYDDNEKKLERILVELPHLREIHYRNPQGSYIQYSTSGFISLIVRVVKHQHDRRIPLELHCYGPQSFFEKERVQYKCSIPPMLRLFLIERVDFKNFPFATDISIQYEWD